MNIMKKGYGPLPPVPQSRRALVLLSVGSLVLLVVLWNAFSVDAPYHLRPPPPSHDDLPGDFSDQLHDPYTASKLSPPADDAKDNEAAGGANDNEAAGGANDNEAAGGTNDKERHGDPLCAHHPDTSNIGVVMKTGATEAYARIPTQLITVLRCVSDFQIFSDKAQTVAGVPIHDSLDEVLPEAMEGNPDFDLYRDQKGCEVDVGPCTAGHDRAKSGWNLDKYKNIHMAEKAYKMMPGKDWYIFVDADTYVLWNTLVEWLGKMDPSEELYFGSVAYVSGFPFSHGGSGYVLSRAAMEAVVGKNPGLGNKYDVSVKSTCCGDYMFSKAAKEVAGLDVHNVWPTINGEKPFTLPFGPTHWCHPVVTMHHLSTEELSSFFEYETAYYASLPASDTPTPMLLRTIHDAFFAPRLASRREDWDNLSFDRLYLNATETPGKRKKVVPEDKKTTEELKEAHFSFEHCRRACEADPKCFQFSFGEGVCAFGESMKVGGPVPGKGNMAGWDVDKIQKWVGEHEKCEEVQWPKVPVKTG